jgi:hypothetical protein
VRGARNSLWGRFQISSVNSQSRHGPVCDNAHRIIILGFSATGNKTMRIFRTQMPDFLQPSKRRTSPPPAPPHPPTPSAIFFAKKKSAKFFSGNVSEKKTLAYRSFPAKISTMFTDYFFDFPLFLLRNFAGVPMKAPGAFIGNFLQVLGLLSCFGAFVHVLALLCVFWCLCASFGTFVHVLAPLWAFWHFCRSFGTFVEVLAAVRKFLRLLAAVRDLLHFCADFGAFFRFSKFIDFCASFGQLRRVWAPSAVGRNKRARPSVFLSQFWPGLGSCGQPWALRQEKTPMAAGPLRCPVSASRLHGFRLAGSLESCPGWTKKIRKKRH